MASIQDKKQFILDHERKLANRMALKVLNKPKLSLWMIIIPVIFAYFFYDLNRFKLGKRAFVKEFLLTRGNILNEAVHTFETGEKPNLQELVEIEHVPESAENEYKAWAKVLIDHYHNLLETKGSSYEALVKTKYKERGRYLLIQDQISKAEGRFFKALRKDVEQKVEDAGQIIKAMEKAVGPLRREEAGEIFA